MKKIYYYAAGVLFFMTTALCAPAYGENLANDALLDLLQEKGFLTGKEVAKVKGILHKKAEREVEVVFEEGLQVRTKDKKTFTARLGGVIQSDLIVFDNHYPIDNDFDIRRARVFIQGRLYEYFSYKVEAELEGSSSNRLVDAYMNFDYFPYLQFRIGQFKEPFSFENLLSDKYLPFNERSMAHYLSPVRDVGFMLHGILFDEALQYAVGIFNGEGRDGSRQGQKDDKTVTGRLVVQPFQHWGPGFLKGLQLGGSCSYARLDTSDFNMKIRTPGRTALYTVQARAKFNITEEVDRMERYGFEVAYTFGPLLLMGEYIRDVFKEVRLSDTPLFDFDMRGWYAGCLLMVTGERPVIKKGVLQRIRPNKNFDIRNRTWGALGIGFRYQDFEAGRIVYESLVYPGYSVREADAFTIAVNWYLNSMMRITINYSRTKFHDPLFLGTHWKGYSYYEDREHAWVTRFQLEF